LRNGESSLLFPAEDGRADRWVSAVATSQRGSGQLERERSTGTTGPNVPPHVDVGVDVDVDLDVNGDVDGDDLLSLTNA
jgi:hypothetical protein